MRYSLRLTNQVDHQVDCLLHDAEEMVSSDRNLGRGGHVAAPVDPEYEPAGHSVQAVAPAARADVKTSLLGIVGETLCL